MKNLESESELEEAIKSEVEETPQEKIDDNNKSLEQIEAEEDKIYEELLNSSTEDETEVLEI